MMICLIYNYINCQSWSMVRSYQEFLILQIVQKSFKFPKNYSGQQFWHKFRWVYFILYCNQSFIPLLLYSWVFSSGHIFLSILLSNQIMFPDIYPVISITKYLDLFLTYQDLKLVFLALGML